MSIVLVVDDDKSTRKLAAKVLKRMGHVAIMSPDGQHAYELLEANDDVDMLITDILMPQMDGRELIKRVRADARLSKMPILAISGYIGPKEISGILEMGADSFIGKPFKVNELEDDIKKCLKH